MKNLRMPLVVLLSLAIISTLSLVQAGLTGASAQGQSTALERGYRTGYSDGFNAGFKDLNDRSPRNFQGKAEYQEANRSYNQAWGTLEDYRDGYQQGYEAGYVNGYDGQPFDSSIPTGLARRGVDHKARLGRLSRFSHRAIRTTKQSLTVRATPIQPPALS